MPFRSQRPGVRAAININTRRASLLQHDHIIVGYTDRNARCRRAKKVFHALGTLEDAPASVIQAVRALYTRYSLEQRRDCSQASTTSSIKKAEDRTANYLKGEHEITVVTTDEAEDAMVAEALLYIPHTFTNMQLLRYALNAGDDWKESMRLARLGDLVQNLLLSEIIFEGTNLCSGFIEDQLKQVIGTNDWQAKRMLESKLWECAFQRRRFCSGKKVTVKNKGPADILEAVLGAVYLDTRGGSHWGSECLKMMVHFGLGTTAALEAFEELDSYGLMRQSSLAKAGGRRHYRNKYRVMTAQLQQAEERLRLIGLAI
ncbi:hypothetical protein PMZ80_005322 [Knufia obscura]|uniref:RNase III domain-containing protein n=1 Tax=Knufia obscura TaxID=1635080 RepID=A0ABR0RQ51_9EURO|nr:hypothetical protein PMZ80_005322 [Knufia obscura]